MDLAKQNISKEANAIFVILFRDYFATEEQKEKLKEILDLNTKKSEKLKTPNYNPDDIFKKQENKDNTQIINQEIQLMEYKESFLVKLKKFIFKLLKKEI